MTIGVGTQPTNATINNQLTNLALQLRNFCAAANALSTQVNGQANGLAYLESIGYGSAANSDNPGDASDAQLALNMISYLNTVAAIVNGNANQPSSFDFNNAVSILWNGQ
jgi:hypothetical protein